MRKSLIPPPEEFEGQLETEQLTRSMEIQMNRIFNFVKSFDFTNTTLVIKRISLYRLIIHPLGEDGKTLDIDLEQPCSKIYIENIFTKKGRKWLADNWFLPEKSVSPDKDKIVSTCAAGEKESNTSIQNKNKKKKR